MQYLTKWMKFDNKVYFAREMLAENKSLSFYELEMENLCAHALKQYQKWDINHVMTNNLYEID